MDHEATLRFVTNLDRAGIESQLHAAALKAAERGFGDVAAQLGEAAGKPRADLDALINRCVAQLKGKEGARGLIDQLEMVQINLPNLG